MNGQFVVAVVYVCGLDGIANIYCVLLFIKPQINVCLLTENENKLE